MSSKITEVLPYIVFFITLIMGSGALYLSYQYSSTGVMPEVFIAEDYSEETLNAGIEDQEFTCNQINVDPTPDRGSTISATCTGDEIPVGKITMANFRVINVEDDSVVSGPTEVAVANGVSGIYEYTIPERAQLADGTYKIQCQVCDDTTCTDWGKSAKLTTQ